MLNLWLRFLDYFCPLYEIKWLEPGEIGNGRNGVYIGSIQRIGVADTSKPIYRAKHNKG